MSNKTQDQGGEDLDLNPNATCNFGWCGPLPKFKRDAMRVDFAAGTTTESIEAFMQAVKTVSGALSVRRYTEGNGFVVLRVEESMFDQVRMQVLAMENVIAAEGPSVLAREKDAAE
jgi:hypothetical protein